MTRHVESRRVGTSQDINYIESEIDNTIMKVLYLSHVYRSNFINEICDSIRRSSRIRYCCWLGTSPPSAVSDDHARAPNSARLAEAQTPFRALKAGKVDRSVADFQVLAQLAGNSVAPT
jgi:hypothetical protein